MKRRRSGETRPDREDRAIFWIIVCVSALTVVLIQVGVL